MFSDYFSWFFSYLFCTKHFSENLVEMFINMTYTSIDCKWINDHNSYLMPFPRYYKLFKKWNSKIYEID